MKILLQILFIFLVIATISICTIKPDLHKNIIVYDSAYTLVSEQEVKNETKEIPVMEMQSESIQKTTVAEKKSEPIKKTEKKQIATNKLQNVEKPKQVAAVKKTETKPIVKTEVKPVQTTQTQKNVTKEVKKESPEPEKKITEKTVEQPKLITQQEETIAWNKWRSTITNQIMQDTKLPPIPNGVVFQFSFTVDKYGKITNVQTGANPSSYTPYAIQYIAPVIRSYQGRSILNFPEGTARTTTNVTGKWRIASTEKFSTPQDYNDIEKVVR